MWLKRLQTVWVWNLITLTTTWSCEVFIVITFFVHMPYYQRNQKWMNFFVRNQVKAMQNLDLKCADIKQFYIYTNKRNLSQICSFLGHICSVRRKRSKAVFCIDKELCLYETSKKKNLSNYFQFIHLFIDVYILYISITHSSLSNSALSKKTWRIQACKKFLMCNFLSKSNQIMNFLPHFFIW